jgi:hypothetical protein
MALQFQRAVEHLELWSASGDYFSFVITYDSPTGPGFHGRAGYLASWRPLHQSRGAINSRVPARQSTSRHPPTKESVNNGGLSDVGRATATMCVGIADASPAAAANEIAGT